MTDEDFDRVDVSPKDIEEALQRPSDFGMASSTLHYDDFFETWSLGPVVLTRASTLLEESNHKALISYLDDLNLPTEWLIVRCNHWGCGWVDHLAFHAVNSDRTPTRSSRRSSPGLTPCRIIQWPTNPTTVRWNTTLPWRTSKRSEGGLWT